MWQRQLVHLIKKEFTLEFRQKASLGGILVYVVATILFRHLALIKSLLLLFGMHCSGSSFYFRPLPFAAKVFARRRRVCP
jgi:hypothetical protein